MSTAIWWIRRDLRLGDNQALAAALLQAQTVLPLFILDPKLLASPYVSQRRLSFLFSGLSTLDAELRRRGSFLTVRQGDPAEVLQQLGSEVQVEGIFAEADVSPYARQRDEKVKRNLPLTLTPGITAHPLESLRKADGSPYRVFTPFLRMWSGLQDKEPIRKPKWLPMPPRVDGMSLPEYKPDDHRLFPAGEAEAQRRLIDFTDGLIRFYAEDRNRVDLEGTSGLSPYLRFGMLSTRQVVWAARRVEALVKNAKARQGVETWLRELAWREFYTSIMYHFPRVRQSAFRQELRAIRWQNDPEGFAAWTEGRTGYPIVDAAMRQLNATGWMHNRARMIAASFLTKNLLINWQEGERYFMQQLLDGDPAANNGGWQWTAGTGTDAAPYFRIFNPVLQGKKFDPQGVYVRRWVPELLAVPDAYIHAPWSMPAEIQARLGIQIGKHYPAPIVEHSFARQRALEAYRRSKA